MITAGSVRGKCSLPSAVQVRVQPACVSTVGAPQSGQCVCRWCHCSSAIALTTSAASRSSARAAELAQRRASRRVVLLDGRGEVRDVVDDAEEAARCVVRRRRRPARGTTACAAARPAVADFAVIATTRHRAHAAASHASSVRWCAARSKRNRDSGGPPRSCLDRPQRGERVGDRVGVADDDRGEPAGAKNSAQPRPTSSTVTVGQPRGCSSEPVEPEPERRQRRERRRQRRPGSRSTARACRSRTAAPTSTSASVTGSEAIRPSS